MKLMLVGVGPHAKRIYLKLIKKKKLDLELIVDLESNKKNVEDTMKEFNFSNTYKYYVSENYRDTLELPGYVKEDLFDLIKKNNITNAIISTEPKAHFAYAKFLLENNINILMDKPITAPIDVITNKEQAKKSKKNTKNYVKFIKKKKLKILI